MNVLLLSDIHANLMALKAVLRHASNKYGDDFPIIHLGDVIDYCMRPNETIDELGKVSGRFVANIRGNHEMAYFGTEAERFSSPRGLAANEFTRKHLRGEGERFISEMHVGPLELMLGNRRLLCVHGDMHDLYWGKMKVEEMDNEYYAPFDFVFSGHTHVPHLRYVFEKGTGRRTAFVNPGSVGQPRNGNPLAQYAVIDMDSLSVNFECVAYDIQFEQALFTEELHPYYRDRLSKGM